MVPAPRIAKDSVWDCTALGMESRLQAAAALKHPDHENWQHAQNRGRPTG